MHFHQVLHSSSKPEWTGNETCRAGRQANTSLVAKGRSTLFVNAKQFCSTAYWTVVLLIDDVA
jgi:hypothetical protein